MTSEDQYSTCPDTPIGDTVRNAQRGDRDAFGRLIERFQGVVYGIAYQRLRNHAESQEVCQDVFIQAMRKIDQLHDPSCFGAWLCSITSNMAINRATRRQPMVAGDVKGFDDCCVDYETPLTAMLVHERTDQVRRGLRRLRSLDRKTLTAFYFDGRSLIEMSREFESPVGTIKRRLHVARKRLAKELEAMPAG